jgi:hypothetical protein
VIPERYAPYTYALFRIVFGLLFFFYGLQKTMGWFGGQAQPLMSLQGAAGSIETLCGFLIMIGLFTRPRGFSPAARWPSVSGNPRPDDRAGKQLSFRSISSCTCRAASTRGVLFRVPLHRARAPGSER